MLGIGGTRPDPSRSNEWRHSASATFFPSARPPAGRRPRKPRSTSQSRARLSLALLLYLFGIACVVTLAPFRFYIPSVIPSVADIRPIGGALDVVTSALLFVPLGFLFPLTRQGREPSPFVMGVLGLVTGAAIATAQLFDAERSMSIANMVATSIGAGLGGWLLRLVNRRIRESSRLTGRLSLELPLMALIYLLVPVLVAASLSSAGDPLQMISLVPLSLLGARLISAVQEHHFGPAGLFRQRAIAGIAAGWTLLGVFPVVIRHPLVGIGLVVLVALVAAHESSLPVIHTGALERRFEAQVLRSAVPYIAVYFATAILLPLANGMTAWHVGLGLTGSDNDLAQQMIRALEPITALVALGYVLAEARGRRELRFRKVAMRIAAQCACVAFAMEGSRGFQRDAGASATQLLLMIAASVVGAGLYHHQRERVRWILIRQRQPVRSRVRVHRSIIASSSD